MGRAIFVGDTHEVARLGRRPNLRRRQALEWPFRHARYYALSRKEIAFFSLDLRDLCDERLTFVPRNVESLGRL
jgi:hypothetical protein